MKYVNYLLLIILLFSGLLLKNEIHISTNLLSLFTSKENIQKLYIANELGYSKEMFIAVKGFDKKARKATKKIVKSLQKLPQIQDVYYKVLPSQKLQSYYKKYHFILADFNEQRWSEKELRSAMKKLYMQPNQNLFYTPINKNDPLDIFQMSKSKSIEHKGKYLILKNYGYLIRVKTAVSPSQMAQARILYKNVQKILQVYPETVAFAGFFYTVENSLKIKSDVKYIVALSTFLLLLIYFVMLRDVKLLSHTFVTLVSSMLFASLVCTTTIENFGVLSLAFGTSLTAVSIDYFFHYYFHNFYQNKKKIDKSVLYGFVTTVVAFGIFAFIPVPLISQISIFALLSLSYAYVVFTFIFPYLEIRLKKELKDVQVKKGFLPVWIVLLVSIALLSYSAFQLKFDENIKNLDYQNIKLQKAQKLFSQANIDNLKPILVDATTQEGLLENLHRIKELESNSYSYANFIPSLKACEKSKVKLQDYDFKSLNKRVNCEAQKVGFKKDYFKNTYLFSEKLPSCTGFDLGAFKSVNLSIYKKDKKFYTIAMVQNPSKLQALNFVSSIDVKTMFAQVAKKMFEDIVFFSFIVLCVIFVLLYFSVREKFFFALNYILFPLAVSLSVVVSFYELNIMHLFSLIILIAIGIDYGIYMSITHKQSYTIIAIKYSLLSTFAAFGVLLFSSITALYSIGLVISLGVGSIYILTRFMR